MGEGLGDSLGLSAGQTVGRYVVESPIGSGGMGFVVSARDPELDRTVAIKVLYREDAKGELWLRREAQALARLNHPAIVGVHDVGVIDGRPFLAMELVEGVTLRAWLEDIRSASDILTVFIAAGKALAAAHGAGLIHCDFKPSNVMIRRGVDSLADAVTIMDFGLARLHEDESSKADPVHGALLPEEAASLLSQDLTGFDKVQGTPKYMAPEQFLLAGVSHATDQYAFCIALYEALWGQSPFRGATPAARMSEQMCGATPLPPPATRSQRTLAEAVLRGLASEPDDRWPSMDALVDALEPPSRRRWWLVGAGVGAGVLALSVFAPQSEEEPCTHLQARADAVWNQAEGDAISEVFAAIGREYATDTWDRSRRELDAWSVRWVDVSTESCRATFERSEQSERDYDTQAHCLTRQLGRLEAVVDLLHAVEVEDVVGTTDSIGALPDPNSCLDAEALDRPSDPLRAAVIDSVYEDLDRCQVLGSSGKASPFVACSNELLETARELEDEDLLLEARYASASAHQDAGHRARAAQMHEAVYFDAKAAGRTRLAARAALDIAFHHIGGGDLDRSSEWLRHAEPLTDNEEGRARVTRIQALIAHHRREPEQAIERARAAVVHAEASGLKRLLGLCLNTLGKILNENGRPTEARAAFQRAVDIYTERYGPTHPRVATSLNNLGTILGRAGELEAALEVFERALGIRRAMLPHEHRHIATGTGNVAETLSRMGKHELALPYYLESAEVFAAVEGDDSPEHGELRRSVATTLRNLDRYDEARAQLQIAQRIFGDRPRHAPQRFATEAELALLDAATGDPEPAASFFTSALETPLGDREREFAKAQLEQLQGEQTPR